MSPVISNLPALLRSRGLALALLFVGALTLLYLDETPLIGLRNVQFDLYQRLMPRSRDSEPAVVVAIDSASLEKYGQWPWPRTLLARLVDQLAAGQPLAIGIDVLLSEADQYSPVMLRSRLPELPAAVTQSLRDPDRQLANAIAAAPVVLAVAGLSKEVPGSRFPNKPLPDFRHSAEAEPHLTRYLSSLTSLPLLARNAHGEGLINAAPDTLSANTERGVLRRVPAVAMVDFVPLLSLPLEMVRQSLGKDSPVSAQVGKHGIERLAIGAYSLPVQANGEILLHYGRSSSNYYLSAADVLDGKINPKVFNKRFAFIGISATGLQDRIITPRGDNLPGVDAHVQVIESLLSGDALRRPFWLPHLEIGIYLAFGLLLIAFTPMLRLRLTGLVFTAMVLPLLGVGYAAFHFGRYLFAPFPIILLLIPVFIVLLSNALITADRQRRQAERDLHASREAAARDAGELDAARRIQMGMLPNPALVFAGETRFELAALLEPARAVGGDYYDCFALDAHRLCLAVGDVSGKGVPASLFMAMAKTLSGALTRRTVDLGQAMREVENELNRENPEFLFVTAFVAILDTDSGTLEYVCAGHDAPLLLRDGQVSRLDITSAGPPLCAVGDYAFVADHAQLQPDDMLCLFTDGVSEASDGKLLYGVDRLTAALCAPAADLSLAQRLNALLSDIRRFEAGQPAYDDLTLLLLRFNGR